MNKRTLMALAASAVLSAQAWAQPSATTQPRGVPTPGPGARGGWHHGGMMGGWDGGGMMGGPGMMGGGMMGMMGGWGWEQRLPDLTSDQRTKITAIQRELRNKQFALMDKMHDEMASVNPYRGGKFDEQAMRGVYASAEKTHRQMFDNYIDAQKRIDALLTPQQRQQLEKERSR